MILKMLGYFRMPSAMYVRGAFTVIGILLGGAVGFVVSGIFLVVIMVVPSAIFGSPDVVKAAVDRSYASHPWGIIACLMMALLSLGALASAWLGYRCSARLFAELTEESRAYSPIALVFCVLLLAFQCAIDLPVAIRLTRHHAITTGHLLQLYPQYHSTASYAYTVHGQNFQKMGSPKNIGKAAVGDLVTVYYSPSDPALSILSPPSGLLCNNFLNVLMVSVFVSVAPFGGLAVTSWASKLPTSRTPEAELR